MTRPLPPGQRAYRERPLHVRPVDVEARELARVKEQRAQGIASLDLTGRILGDPPPFRSALRGKQ